MKYIRDIPLKCRQEMCRMLDVSFAWVTLAGSLNFTNDDVQSFKSAIYRPAGSPTDDMLTVWDYGCHTITELFHKLYEIKHARCMMLLKDLVDPGLHNLIREIQGVQPTEEAADGPEIPGHPQLPPLENPPNPGTMGQPSYPQDTKTPSYDQTAKPQATQGSWNDAYGHHSNPHRERKEGLTANIDKSSEKVTGLESPFKGWQGERTESSISVGNKSSGKGESSSGSSGLTSIRDEVGRKETMENYETQTALSSLLHMSFEEIRKATRDFDDCCKLGEGSFGTVYHSMINMSHYAVKCMKKNDYMGLQTAEIARADQLKELRALVRYRHSNIVALLAFCFDGPSPCLLYEFMENGSLEDNLLCKAQREPLDWRRRHKIAEGSAQGINFLHRAQDQPLIHGDIKSANILLDKHFEPKIADFGLARHGPKNGKTYCYLETKNAHGTLPYLPEEYKRSSKLSTKVDVYSFGVVLMEILAGERVADSRREPNRLLTDIIEDALELRNPEAIISHVRDRKCPDWPWDIAWEMLQLALACTRSKFKQRPEFNQILNTLMNNSTVITQRDEMQRQRQRQRQDFPVQAPFRKTSEVFSESYYEANTQRYGPPTTTGVMGYAAPTMGPQGAPMRREFSIESNNPMVGPAVGQDPRYGDGTQRQPMQFGPGHYQSLGYGGQRSESGIRRHTLSETSDENNMVHESPLTSLTSTDALSKTDQSMFTPVIKYPSGMSGHSQQSQLYGPQWQSHSQSLTGYAGQTLQRYPQQYQTPEGPMTTSAVTQPQTMPPRTDFSYYTPPPPVIPSIQRRQQNIEDHMKRLDISQLPTKPMGNPLQQADPRSQQALTLPSNTPKREPEQNTDILPSYQPPGLKDRSIKEPTISVINEESDEEGTVLKSSLTTSEMHQYLSRSREPTEQTEKMQGSSTGQLTSAATTASSPYATTPATSPTTATTIDERHRKVSDPLNTSLTTSQMRQFLPSKREPTEDTDKLPGEGTDNLSHRELSSAEDPHTIPPLTPSSGVQSTGAAPSGDSKDIRQPPLPSEGHEEAPASSDLQESDISKVIPQVERGYDVQSDRCHSVPPNMAALVSQGCGVATHKVPQQMTEPINNSK